MRLDLSDLTNHKNKHPFGDTQSDLCACNQEAETTVHFFCRCSLFLIPRFAFMDTVSGILAQNNILINSLDINDLVKIYLYGNDKFTDAENRSILLATIKYITDSNRFQAVI